MLEKEKRFGGKWLKQTKLKDLEYVKEYFGYGNEKAREALNILTNKQIEDIKKPYIRWEKKMSEEIQWSESMLEVTIKQPDDF